MDDAELDQTLKSALSVSPSPEFVVKVRTAIREEPTGAIVTRWLVPAGAVALLAAAAIGLTSFGSQPAIPAETPGERHAGVDIVLPSAPPAGDVASDRVPQLATRHVTRQSIARIVIDRPAATATPEFAVIFSPTDAAAYRRLFESVGSVPYVLSDEPAFEPETAMTAIDIAPIEIAPLHAASDNAGVFQ